MSRNVRQKFPQTPVKAAKRRGSDSSNSSVDLSSDGGYSALDEDSDDSEDDDEEGVNAAEEEHMIADELDTRRRDAGPPRPESDDEEDDADGEDDGGGDDDDDDDDDDDNLDMNRNGEVDDDAESGSWAGIVSEVESPSGPEYAVKSRDQAGVKRQVRFAVPDSDSDSDSTTTETSNDIHDMFPDIFVAQASLDPGFRREIEQDADDASSVASYWDFHDTTSPDGATGQRGLVELLEEDDAEASTPVPSPEDAEDLDGYDSDGDTTEEDVPEPPARRKQLHVRRVEAAGSSDSDTDRPIRIRRGRPRSGQFDLDRADEKPIAVMHPVTRKLIIFTPEKARGFDLSPESFRGLESFFTSLTQTSPITRHSSQNVMMAPMLSSCNLPDLLSSYPFGPIEAFLPSADVNAAVEDESDYSGEQVDEEEAMLNLDDFIEFEALSSGDEDEADDAGQGDENEWDGPEGDDEGPTTPDCRPSTADSSTSDANMDIHPLLAHFENNSDVGAFRRNQINQQLILSGAATAESLAFSGPYLMGTLKGIKSDRLDGAATSLSPVRRRKRSSVSISDANEVRRSALDSKRKASEGLHSQHHKKHRSISEVGDIAL